MIRLSPNEVERIRKLEDEQARIKRLVSVRQQARQLSKSKISQFNSELDASVQELLNTLEQDWYNLKQDEVAALEQQIEAQQFGKAYEEAGQVKVEFQKENAQLLAKVKSQHKVEESRFQRARASVMEERLKSLESQTMKLQKLVEARKAESERAKRIAELGRRNFGQALPVHAANPESMRRKPHVTSNELFENTYFARDYIAIHADKERRDFNAMDMADHVREETTRALAEKQQKLKLYTEKSQERFNAAYYGVLMDKQREKMLKELEQVKQLARLKYHKPPAKPKQEYLTRFFEKEFAPVDHDVIVTRIQQQQ